MVVKKKSLRHRVAKDAIWNFSASIISKIGGLIFTILLARFLLPEGFGLYGLATSIALIFLTFADLGINQTMMRFVSSEVEKNKAKATAYYRYILRLKVLWSLAVSIILLIVSYPLSNYIFKKPLLFTPLLVLSLYIFVLAIEGFLESLFYIANKVRYIALKEIILQLSRILMAAAVFYFVAKTYQLIGIMFVLLITILIVLLFVLYYSKKILSFLFQVSKVSIDKKRVLKFIGYLTFGNLSLLFFGYVDTIFLGIFVSSAYIGYYRAAFALVFGIAGLLSFVNVFLLVLTTVKKNKLSDIFNKILRYSFILAIPTTFGLVFLARYVLKAIYGYEYLQAALPFYFLAPMIILTVLVGNSLTLFSAREKPRQFARLTLAVTIINIILNYIFIILLLRYSELWAIAGAAIATLISWIIYSVGAVKLSRKQIGIYINWKSFSKPVLASIIMSIFLYYFNMFVKDMTLISGLIEVAIGALIYFIALLLMRGINKEDFEPIRRLFGVIGIASE